MSWSDQIFNYCERGSDPAFWAEPLNALTNAAFIIAALLAARELVRGGRSTPRFAEAGLIAIVFVIGIGSFLFHTYATRWSAQADNIPIAVFMLVYLAYALRRFLGLNWLLVVLAVGFFYASLRYAGSIECTSALLPISDAAGARCLNGTAGYVPAAIVLALVAVALAVVRHPAWRYLALATIVLILSMAFRTIDREVCEAWTLGGRAIGTHFLWHVFNALTLYILLVAAIRHGSPRSEV